jgi:hypothetical protein
VFENPARWDNFHFADEICLGSKLSDSLFVDSEAVGSVSCPLSGAS